MRQIPLKTLRARLTKELENLPFEITRNGEVVGIVSKGLNQGVPKTPKGLNQTKEFKPPVAGRTIPEIEKKIPVGNIHPRFDICPKHKVYYNSCGCK